MKFSKKVGKFKLELKKNSQLLLSLFVAIAIIAISVLVQRIQHKSFERSSASSVHQGAELYFQPSRLSIDRDDTFTVNVFVDSGDNPITAVDAKIVYDPGYVEIKSISPHKDTPFSSYPMSRTIGGGIVQISGNLGASNTISPVEGNSIPFATITFHSIRDGVNTVSFVFQPHGRNDSNVVSFSGIGNGAEVEDVLEKTEPITISISSSNHIQPTFLQKVLKLFGF